MISSGDVTKRFGNNSVLFYKIQNEGNSEDWEHFYFYCTSIRNDDYKLVET